MLALALAALTLVPPVPGEITRGFAYEGDPFAAGHHRGVDLAAAPGTPVRAACSGRVTFAGRAGASGRTVTIRCGRWRVTHLPLATLATATGATVRAGAEIGTAARARGHDGLHLGVREASDPLGYVAPALQSAPPPAPPATPRPKQKRPTPTPPHPEPLPSAPRPRPAPRPRVAPQPRPAPSHHPGSSPLAPWPAWAGLALLLAGATGAGAAKRARKRRAVLAQPRAAPVR